MSNYNKYLLTIFYNYKGGIMQCDVIISIDRLPEGVIPRTQIMNRIRDKAVQQENLLIDVFELALSDLNETKQISDPGPGNFGNK